VIQNSRFLLFFGPAGRTDPNGGYSVTLSRASDQALVGLNGIFSHAMHMPRNDAATLGTSDRARRGGETLDGFMRHGSRGSATGTSQT
jgi:hypothetical protein